MNAKIYGYVYIHIQSEPDFYTVGFYSPDGRWNHDSDYNTRDEAAARVAHLNGATELMPNSNRDTKRIIVIKDHLECPLREGLVELNQNMAHVFSRCKKTNIECHTIKKFPEDCPLNYVPQSAPLPEAFTFIPDKRQIYQHSVEGEIMCGQLKIAVISLIQGRPGMAEENIAHLLTNANIAQAFRGCVGYLRSLPKNVRPDDTWFKPVEEALEQLEGK